MFQSMARFEIVKFSEPKAVAEAAASEWLRLLQSPERATTPFSVALAGGRIAGIFFSTVARLAQNQSAVLDAVHFFWGDERCVPPNDPESNFGMARELLLQPLKVPDSRIHRIQGEKPPELAATDAEKDLLGLVTTSPDGRPLIDLIFLGMGEDGHVASLFPGEPEAVMLSKSVYRAVVGPKPPPRRITLGYPAIAAARAVWVLVSGTGKERAFRESLSETGTTPLARVLHSRRQTRIFTDI